MCNSNKTCGTERGVVTTACYESTTTAKKYKNFQNADF